jgi:ABC-type Mn2+/Zn2+ transport system ATPase subunit
MPDTGEALITATDLSLAYDGEAVVDRASLVVTKGDFVGIVGPSGSGKTTLLKGLAGAMTPSSGKIARRRGLRTGYVPQVETINWFFPVTVMEVVQMAGDSGRILPWPSSKTLARAEGVLAQLGISHLKQRHIRSLSGGQQQRVFIARALMNAPHVLLMDEPTSGVDVATRHDVLHLLHDLNHAEDLAIVITTHDLNGIAAHMHTLVCLNREVIAAGAPSQILTPDVLERTYGAPMEVLSHGGMPVVIEHFDSEPDESPIRQAHHHHEK